MKPKTSTPVHIDAEFYAVAREVAEALTGEHSYDELDPNEQAVVRATCSERMEALAQALRLDVEFETQWRPYVELDDHGAVVRRG